MKKTKKINLGLLFFCAPALLVYALFKLYPAVSGVYYSLTNWNGLKKTYDFVGLSNFIELFSDRYFWNSMWFTFRYVIVIVIVANVVALTLAVAIESRRRAKGLFRTIFYMPNMISMVIGGYMWMFIFTKVLYYMADNWGWKFLDHSWIGDVKYSFIAIIIVAAWGAVGYLMIIYMAALRTGKPQGSRFNRRGKRMAEILEDCVSADPACSDDLRLLDAECWFSGF